MRESGGDGSGKGKGRDKSQGRLPHRRRHRRRRWRRWSSRGTTSNLDGFRVVGRFTPRVARGGLQGNRRLN
eukprot:4810738-Prymnesium_polylepis.1